MKNELHRGWKIAGRIAAVVALAAVASAQGGGRMPGIPKWGGSRGVDPNPPKLEITHGKRSVLRMAGAPGALVEVTINLNERDIQIGKKGFGAARHTTLRGFFDRGGVVALDLPVMPEFKVLHAWRADSATIDGYKTVTVVLDVEVAPEPQPFASAQKLGDLAKPLGAGK